MSTEQTVIEEQSTNEQINASANPFAEASWADPSVKVENQSTESFSNQSQSNQEPESEIYDANEYLKNKLGFDDWESAATQIDEMRNRKGIDFENDESRKYYEYAKEQKEDELYKFLDEKRKIDRLSNSEIKDTTTAAEIIKLSMYQKNKELDASEVDFLFNEKFQRPEKPEQKFDELDSEYESRLSTWESRTNEIDKKLIIEAKLAKPELEKIKSNLILPDITSRQREPELSQEVLDAQRRYMDNYHSSVNDTINSFEGFSATVKDEGVDFSVAYVPSYEEKQAVANQMKEFADNNLDANMIFAERWVKDDGTIDVRQMTKDLFLIQNEGKITQKYVNDAANKRLAMHLKKQSNIDFSSSNQSGTFSPDNSRTEMDKLAALMFAK